jgi:hypothetical protein
MNKERVNQLIQQVGTDVSGKWISIDDAEKLTELMVQECYVALFPALRDMISRGQAYNLIKEHFGVEK